MSGRGRGTAGPPAACGEDNLHFMAQSMEAWLCSDAGALERYFREGFKAAKLPQRHNLELEPKSDLNEKLAAATRSSRRGSYRKGAHLEVLGFISPLKVVARCPTVAGFVAVLASRL